jgi:hypothetical protein
MQIVHVKLCFLLDCTGSMGQWIQAAKDQIEAIVETTQREYQSSDLRFEVAFVGYRDYGDEVQHEVVPFTDVDRFLSEVRGIVATGGDDIAEDVAGGLRSVRDLHWNDADVRTLIHIADAPPHGLDYHEPHISDRFPEGDPRGNDLRVLLRELAHDVDMTFIGLNRSTDMFIKEALAAYRSVQKHTFTVADLRPQDTRFLTPIAMRTVSDSIQRYTSSQDPVAE